MGRKGINDSMVEKKKNMRVGKEKARMNEIWKGGLIWMLERKKKIESKMDRSIIWKWERKGIDWIKSGKENIYEIGNEIFQSLKGV